MCFFFSSRRRHTRSYGDWSSDVCSSDLLRHRIGDSVLMLADPMPQSTVKPPKALGGTSVGIFLYVEDVDEVVRQAIEIGRASCRESGAGCGRDVRRHGM